jgi:hypothetical protein
LSIFDPINSEMWRMQIIIFTSQLWSSSGGEINVRDWALGLRARGHTIRIFTPVPGALAEEIRIAGVPVIADPSVINDVPDIMFGSGVNDTVALLARFPQVPIVQITQQWDSWAAFPCPLPQVMFHVAVSQFLADMLVNEFGVARRRVRVVHNAVDFARVQPRQTSLPATPARALAFVKGDTAIAKALGTACTMRNIAIDYVGPGSGRIITDPLAVMPQYDLVIGTGRTAIEGVVAGAAVLVADHRGLGGMLTPKNIDLFRAHNFGLNLLTRPLHASNIGAEIDKYDPSDAAAVSLAMRNVASLDLQLDQWEGIFAEAIAEFRRAPPTEEDWRKPLSAYLASHLPRHGEPSPRHARFHTGSPISDKIKTINDRLAALERDIARMPDQGVNLLAPDADLDCAEDSSALAIIRCVQEHPATYLVTAIGEESEHYITKRLFHAHGELVFSLEVRRWNSPTLRVQVLNARSDGVYGDFDFYREEISVACIGRARNIKGGVIPAGDEWYKIWLCALLSPGGGPITFIIQLGDEDGQWSFKAKDEAVLVRKFYFGQS